MKEPRDVVDKIEMGVELPAGDNERFSGFGVMGVPFSSGHFLALRRFPNTSIGEGYTSVWHRSPSGRWVFIQDRPPQFACSRYFGSAVDVSLEQKIRIYWYGPRDFTVSTEGEFPITWNVSLSLNTVSRMMNAAAGWLPDRWWQNPSVLKSFGRVGGFLLGSGRLNLTGKVPNGQQFIANPKTVWIVEYSSATICGLDLGPTGRLPSQVNLADIWLPQSGRFFIGNVYMESLDPERHLTTMSRSPELQAEQLCYT